VVVASIWRAGCIALAAGIALSLPATGQDNAEPLSSIAEAAAQRGVRTCLVNIDRLAKNLAIKHDIGVYIFNKLDAADSNVVSLSMELTPSPSGGPFYVSASFVPVSNGGCQVLVESVLSWMSGCPQVQLAYPGYNIVGQLLADVSTLASTGPERLFLLPTPTGCISVEKSVYF